MAILGLDDRMRLCASQESGFTLVEVLVAVLVMTVGIITMVGAFDSSRRLGTNAEERQTASAFAERELQRIQALPWKSIALSVAPTMNPGAGPKDPTHYLQSGTCVGTGPTSSPCYQWDWSPTALTEPLVIDALNGDPTANPTPWTTTVTAGGTSLRLSGNVYRFITWVNDQACSLPTCGAGNDAKRIFVAVTVSGLNTPVTVGTIVTNTAGGTYNALSQSNVTCQDGAAVVSCLH